ncbi:MAG: M16 family metallopeptidase [Alphaproteobacteria bacterium]
MSVEQHTLSNGATVLIDHMPDSDEAALGYYFRVGSRFETKKENGLAHFLEHMAFKGTNSRDVRQLAIEMDDLGAQSNAFTGKEGTCYFLAGAAEDAFTFNEIVSDMAMNMALPVAELERERGAILEEIKMYDDQATSLMQDHLGFTAYPNQAYGRTILGPSINIENFDREAFEKFRNKHYHAGNLIVSVAGNVDPQKILKDIERTTSQLSSGKRSKAKPAKYAGGDVQVQRPDQQINLMLSFQASAAGKPENTAEAVMNKVLSGGQSSRLFVEVREKRGLVYSVQSGLGRSFDTGQAFIYAGTSPSKVSALVPVICDELNKMRQEKISDKELARAKKKLIVSNLSGGSANGRMRSNAGEFNLKEKISTKDEFRARVDAVTKEDVQKAAQDIFSGKPTLSSVGPSDFPDYDDVVQRLDI